MKNVVVVDLDGCLCRINSFRYWLFFCSLFFLFSFRWCLLFKFNRYIFLRTLGKLNRVEMKRGILSITEKMPRTFVVIFSYFLFVFVNKKVSFEITRYERLGFSVILCTAAPFCYVNIFAEKFNFSRVFATQSVVMENWKENMANEKLDSVVSYYGENICFECVITDHIDDLPLLLLAKRRLLVRPSNATLEAIQGQFDFEVI